MMTNNIKQILCAGLLGCGIAACLSSCKSGDPEYDDYEGGTTVYFPYQYPVRTIRLCPDEGDTRLDLEHKCQIMATFGGSYNGSNGSVQVQVNDALCNNLTFADGTPVKPMPTDYYSLSTTSLDFNGTFNGRTTVQLNDAFFNDPDAVKATYVIPLMMTGQTGFGKILTGTDAATLQWQPVGQTTIARCDETQWNIQPMDYVLYCVKFQNKYSGVWLTHGTTSTADIESASTVQISTKSLNSCVYTVSYQKKYQAKKIVDGAEVPTWEERLFTADLLLTFDGSDNCTITSLTPGVTASGTGSWKENSELKAWGNKDRNGMELNYTVDFGADDYGNAIEKGTTNEKLVWQRSGLVAAEEFAPLYN